jgi:hypothetical protein
MTLLYTCIVISFELRRHLCVPLTMRILLGLILLMFAVVASAAIRTVHVTGTVANIQSWEISGYYSAMVANAVGMPRHGTIWTSPQLMIDMKTGRFEGEIECEVVRNGHGHWVNIHLVSVAGTYQVYDEMVLRAPYAKDIDLGTFDWKPSYYRWSEGALVIDTAVPRDTVIGNLFGDHARISPINPERGDSMRFEFVWTNSGQPQVASFGDLYLENESIVACDLTFGVRTDTDVYGESWPHRVEVVGRFRTGGDQYISERHHEKDLPQA